jgi:glycosyltransferase involved in cell wall biosynthesis
MKISVVIPCYNGTATLGEQLAALADQQFSERWEVIVADNASTDEPEAIVSQYLERIPSLRMVNASERKGPSFARNKGCEVATGDALLFCDADDVVAPGWLAAMHGALLEHDFVGGAVEYSKLNKRGGGRAELRNAARVWDYLPFLPHAVSCNMGVKRWVHESIGGFDESLRAAEDVDYSWRVQLAGTALKFVPDAIVYYRRRDTLRAEFRQNVTYGEYTVRLYKKYLAKGLPKKNLKEGLLSWVKLMRQWRLLTSDSTRARWVRQFGHAVGRLKGSMKHRVLAF